MDAAQLAGRVVGRFPPLKPASGSIGTGSFACFGKRLVFAGTAKYVFSMP
jgi:hypothetical protein